MTRPTPGRPNMWPPLDNYGWASGHGKRFGPVHAGHGTRPRPPDRPGSPGAAVRPGRPPEVPTADRA